MTSKVDALVGFSGFVGGNLASQHRFGAHFNSKNIVDLRGRSFRTLVHAGTQARKWWANENPEQDWRSIDAALNALREARADHLVLISTIDVVPLVSGADETFDCNSLPTHAYGRNRLRLEREVTEVFPRVTILRLPALFGGGLKKNVIFDLMNDNILDKINPHSRFQYYDLRRIWADLERAVSACLGVVHLVTEPLATSEIVETFFPQKTIGADAAPAVEYDFRTRHADLFGGGNGYICDRRETLRALGRFVADQQSTNLGPTA